MPSSDLGFGCRLFASVERLKVESADFRVFSGGAACPGDHDKNKYWMYSCMLPA